MSASLRRDFPLASGIYVSACVYVAKHIYVDIYMVYTFFLTKNALS